MRFQSRKFTLFTILVVAWTAIQSPVPAHAWKPTTHVYLAELALMDALDDGMLTFYATDYENGQLLTDGAGQVQVIGEYPVDSQILAVLRSNPEQFRAGVLGPDAYPDISTGQQMIHPEGGDIPGVDVNLGGSGSDPWLRHLWNRAFTGCDINGSECDSRDMTPANQAFVLGFLSHAAGDMYGHTFINYYAGGPFHFQPRQENAIKHVVLEGYIDKRTPRPFSFDARIDGGVDQFIYRNMIYARPNTYLANPLLTGENSKYSIPSMFSALRVKLQGDIDAYYAKLGEYDHSYDQKVKDANNCETTDISCSKTVLLGEAAVILVKKTAYQAGSGPQITYKEAWRDDIDKGLRALPQVSHELALAIFFNPTGFDRKRAERIAEDYKNQHLLSMMGTPDAVGASLDLINQALDALGIPAIQEVMSQLRRGVLDYLLQTAFDTNLDQIEEYLTSPEMVFNPTLSNTLLNQEGAGHPISLTLFNQQQLRIADTGYLTPSLRYDYREFPPAYNSVTMIKLLFMDTDGVYQLLRHLHSETTTELTSPNAMLGYIQTLDGSNQWIVNQNKMVLAKDCVAYRKIFMRQMGEDTSICGDVSSWLEKLLNTVDMLLSRISTESPLALGQQVPNKRERDVVEAITGKVQRGTPAFNALVKNDNPDIVFKEEEQTGKDADHMMTPKLKSKLDLLASLVKKEWPGRKLRVTEAWDEDSEHASNSLHYEGRAADITIDDQDQGKLGRLAQLAVKAGFNWVWYENKLHVHVSVSK